MANTIYHYTHGDALCSIVKNRTIRFGDIRCMNDYNEQKLQINQIYHDMIAPTGDISNVTDTYRCFVLSCSVNEDSLPMWNYYAKSNIYGGYNIGFDVHVLIRNICDNIIAKIPGAKLVYGRISYCETTNDGQIKNVDSSKIHLVKSYDTIGKHVNLTDNNFFKAREYGFEQEYRMIILIPNEEIVNIEQNMPELFDYKYSNGMFKPFINLHFTNDAIVESYIAPSNFGIDSMNNLQNFYEDMGMVVSVKKSKITSRF